MFSGRVVLCRPPGEKCLRPRSSGLPPMMNPTGNFEKESPSGGNNHTADSETTP